MPKTIEDVPMSVEQRPLGCTPPIQIRPKLNKIRAGLAIDL
jgi:hypothetical protein